MSYVQPDDKTMRIMLGLRPGERARSEEPAQQRAEYQFSMLERENARAFWASLSKADRLQHIDASLEWGFLSGIEQAYLTRRFLNEGIISPDYEYEQKQRECGRLSA